MTVSTPKSRFLPSLLATAVLGACGGGGGGTNSTPAPVSSGTNFKTAEYDLSDGPTVHNAISAYNAGASGTGIIVGVIDSGIARSNPEFSGRISSASAAFNGTNNIQDEGGHGTAVTTILAAARNNRETLGMAWGATILTLRTDTPGSCNSVASANSGCSHSTIAIAQALDHARVNGARVANISLGGGAAPQHLLDAVSRATLAGVIVVVAAGNGSLAAPDPFATSMADPLVGHGLVIIAGSNNADGSHSSFSNGAAGYEGFVLTALGDHVNSQDQTGARFLFSGTSFSAPQISGAIALMAQAFPNLTSAQIVQRLFSTATDAGATGADSIFGQGILNLAAAFAPAGSTSLAGSTVPISVSDNGTLSPAMGDAMTGAATQAVALDSLGRAYRIGLQSTFSMAAPRTVLGTQLSGFRRTLALQRDGMTASLQFAASPFGLRGVRDIEGLRADAAATRALSGSLVMRIDSSKTAAFAFGQGLGALDGRSGVQEGGGAYLAAQRPSDSMGFENSPKMAFVSRYAPVSGVNLSAGMETGRVDRFDAPEAVNHAPADGYSRFEVGAGWRHPGIALQLRASAVREQHTLLGARFAPMFGFDGARSLFADAEFAVAPLTHWSLSGAVRHGWTHANGNPVLGAQARLASTAWSVDVARVSFLTPSDRLSIRISQPLRVTSGGLRLSLPGTYDWTTGAVGWSEQHIALSPGGRQMDGEVSYAAPLGNGWMMLNTYVRHDPGNIAFARDDVGGALRFTLGY